MSVVGAPEPTKLNLRFEYRAFDEQLRRQHAGVVDREQVLGFSRLYEAVRSIEVAVERVVHLLRVDP